MRKIIEETKQHLVDIMKGDEELGLYELEKKLDIALENETSESLTNWLKEKRDTMAQQTSVEWLINELIFKQEYEHLPNNYVLMSDKDIDKIIEQARKMFENQIVKAVDSNFSYDDNGFPTLGQQYYDNTYKK